MKKIARFICLVLVVTSVLSGCGSKEPERVMPELSAAQQEMYENNSDYEKELSSKNYPSAFEAKSKENLQLFNEATPTYVPRPVDAEIDFEITRVNSETEKMIENLGKDVCRFINDVYEIEWQFPETKVFTAPAVPGVIAEHFDGVIVLYGEYVDNNSFRTTLVHELIHYLFHVNTGSAFCYLYNSDGLVAGRYLHEAVTEYITYRYIREVWGMSILEINDGETKTQAYDLLVYNIEEINIAFGIDLAREAVYENLDAVSEIINKSVDDSNGFVIILNSIDVIKETIGTEYTSYSYATQAELNQVYFYVANNEQDKRLIEATEECLLREFLIYPNLRKPKNAIGVWNEIAYNKDTLANTLH